jgi:ADP-heptose:LPS heptosyltransferase
MLNNNNEVRVQEQHEGINNIAIFRALYLGDMLCIIPAVRAIRVAYPKAKITLIGLPWAENFVKRFQCYFDAFIEFPGWPGLPEQLPAYDKLPAFIAKMQSFKFDLVLQMQGNGAITNNMCMLWNANNVCGLRRTGDYCPDENLFPESEDDDHEVLRFLKLVDALNITRQGIDLEFPFAENEIKNFLNIKKKMHLPEGPYICIHPGARDPNRRWPAENFAYVAGRLAAEGHTVVLTGSEDERALLQEVSSHTQYPVFNTVQCLGQIDLGDLASIVGHSAFLISNDTGVSHIAAALRVPSVIIFSPFSNPARWAPLDKELHRTIPAKNASHPKNVVDVVLNLLRKTKKGTASQQVPVSNYIHSIV